MGESFSLVALAPEREVSHESHPVGHLPGFLFGGVAELPAQFVPVIAKQRSIDFAMQPDGTEKAVDQLGEFGSTQGLVARLQLRVFARPSEIEIVTLEEMFPLTH